MIDQVEEDEDYAEVYAEELEGLLENLHQCDFFGTEGQNDPRGDFREGVWSMLKVEGIDS